MSAILFEVNRAATIIAFRGMRDRIVAVGVFADGSKQEPKYRIAYDCVTGLTGRALADTPRPGVDARW